MMEAEIYTKDFGVITPNGKRAVNRSRHYFGTGGKLAVISITDDNQISGTVDGNAPW